MDKSSPSFWIEWCLPVIRAFWIEFLPAIQALPGVLTACSTVAGVIIANRGLNKWHKETIGKRRAELAEQALASMYEVRDIFQWARSPDVYVGEGQVQTNGEPEGKEIKDRCSRYSVVIERLQRDRELFAKLRSQYYTFASYFGTDGAKPLLTIGKIHQEIMETTKILILMAAHEDFPENRYNKDLANHRAVIGWGERPDKIDDRIDQAVQDMEAVCHPILKDQPKHQQRSGIKSSLDQGRWLRRP